MSDRRNQELSRWWQLLNPMRHPGESLRSHVVHAGVWGLALRLTLRLLSLFRIFVIARLLAPADFGLVAIVGLVFIMLESFSQLGFRQALIQRKGDIQPYLDTAWTVEMVRWFVLAAMVFFSAPLIASFFSAQAAVPLLRVGALGAFISGFTNISVVYFDKELEFRRRFIHRSGATLVEVSVGIALAFILRNAWALVLGSLAGTAVAVALSYILRPYRPRLRLEWAKAKELYAFGRWILLTTPLRLLGNRGDKLFVGKLMSTPMLGLYEMASRISDAVRLEVTTVGREVGFPALSKIQTDPHRLRQAFSWSVETVGCIVIPASLVLFLLAEEFTRLVLGDQWLPMVAAMRVLTMAAALNAISETSQPLLDGVGRPRLEFQKELVRGVVLLATLYPLIQWWGLSGAAWAVLAAALAGLLMHFAYVRSILGLGILRHARSLILPAVLSAGVTGSIVFIRWTIGTQSIPGFLVAVSLAGISYLMLGYLSWRLFDVGPLQLVVAGPRHHTQPAS